MKGAAGYEPSVEEGSSRLSEFEAVEEVNKKIQLD